MGRIRNSALLVGIMMILLIAVVACFGGDDSAPADTPVQSEAPAQTENTTDTAAPETEDTASTDAATDTAAPETEDTTTAEESSDTPTETAESESTTAEEPAAEEEAAETAETEEEATEATSEESAETEEEETAETDDATQSTPVTAGDGVYTVRAGDTLLSIGATLGVNWNDIAELNDLEFPYTIYVGDQLTLPETAADDTQIHVVEVGDTVFELSQEFGVNWADIANINGLRWPYWIYVGQELIIPAS